MSKKLTVDDVKILNEEITSANPDLSQKARKQLTEYIGQPDSFASSTAEDWARKIYKRITTSSKQVNAHRFPDTNFMMFG